jgi:rare lipoprotein A
MARFYCKEPKATEGANRATFATPRGLTQDASPLTFARRQEIMAEPGVRNLRVLFYALTKSKDLHERLQPQGGRSICAHQQIRGRRSHHSGERNGGVNCPSERRSGTGCPPAFHQSITYSGGEAREARRLYGKPAAPQVSACSFGNRSRRFTIAIFVSLLSFLLSGCGEHKQAQVNVPSPPPISAPESQTSSASVQPPAETTVPAQSEEDAFRIPINAKPIMVETGLASWYGGPYNKRRGSNGEIYNMNAMTAAHRTLPLGSIVRVTNLKTGRSALVRITDRGPFVEGRVLDLSQAAAKKVDVLQPGVAMVRIEVMRAPSSLETGGRWAVQIGAFEKEHSADKLADHLSRRYQTAKVQCFSSPIGDWWVRVRVQADDRKLAEEVARQTQTPQGSIFLVRLD